MNIGILGAGVMGTALARTFRRCGHQVALGSRRNLLTENGFAFTSYAGAARFGQIVVLATLWDGAHDAIVQCDSLKNRILVDATNPEDQTGRARALSGGASGAEVIAGWAKGARVVKGFNHVYAEILDAGPTVGGLKASVFYCGDDSGAKSQVRELIDEAGFDPVDSGPLEAARSLEALGALMVELVRRQGHAPSDVALKLLRRAS